MIVLPHKEKLIKDNFLEFSFEDDDNSTPDYNKFKKLSSTDQYYLAERYNWDDGITILDWIIDSKKCDKGTASLIFWSAEPDFYFEKSENEIANYEKDTFLLLKKLLENLLQMSLKDLD